MFSLINEHINRCVDFTEVEMQRFNELLVVKQIPKKTLMLQEGEVCNFEAYINKGCIRTYYIDPKGAEVTLQFAIEDWWVSDIGSFHERKPSKLFIQTLEPSEVLLLSPETKEKLLHEIPKFERVFRLMIQKNLTRLQDRFLQTVTTTAVEKYLDFIDRYPTIPQRVPQHYIASYLGFSPEFLSKVRTRLSKGEGLHE